MEHFKERTDEDLDDNENIQCAIVTGLMHKTFKKNHISNLKRYLKSFDSLEAFVNTPPHTLSIYVCIAIFYLYIQNEIEIGSKNNTRRWSPSAAAKMHKYLFGIGKDILDEDVKIVQRLGNCTAYDDAIRWVLSLRQYDLHLQPDIMKYIEEQITNYIKDKIQEEQTKEKRKRMIVKVPVVFTKQYFQNNPKKCQLLQKFCKDHQRTDFSDAEIRKCSTQEFGFKNHYEEYKINNIRKNISGSWVGIIPS